MKINIPDLLHSLKLGICLVDLDNKIVFINNTALDVFNLTGRNIIGAAYNNLIFPFIDERFKDINKLPLVLSIRNAKKYNYILRVADLQKNVKTINCMVMPIYDSDNQVNGGVEIYATEEAFPTLFGAADYQRVANMFVSKVARSHITTATKQSHNAITALKKYRTMVFIDIVGFTTMSETLDPHDVIEILNIFYDRVNMTINLYQGDIDKFIGDAMLIVFENAEAAVRCGTDIILKDLPLVNDQLKLRFPRLEPLKIHVGINTGWVILGEMGARDRKDFTVIGDNVNIAARVQGLTPPNEVWISGKTLANIGGVQKLFEPTENMKLKGKQQALALYKFNPEKLDLSKRVLLFEKGKNLQTTMRLKLQRIGVKDIVIVENNEAFEREAKVEFENMIVGSSVAITEIPAIQKILSQAGKDPNHVITVASNVSPAAIAALAKLGIKAVIAYSEEESFENSLSGLMRSQQVNKIERLNQSDEEVHKEELKVEKKEEMQPVRYGFTILPTGRNYEIEIVKVLAEENILALRQDIQRMWVYKSNRAKDILFIFKFDKILPEEANKANLDKLFTELYDDEVMQYDSWKTQPLVIRAHNDDFKKIVVELEKLFQKKFLLE